MSNENNPISQELQQYNHVPPFRVGRKQRRAILDSNGIELGIFKTGSEDVAIMFCAYLNLMHEKKVRMRDEGYISIEEHERLMKEEYQKGVEYGANM